MKMNQTDWTQYRRRHAVKRAVTTFLGFLHERWPFSETVEPFSDLTETQAVDRFLAARPELKQFRRFLLRSVRGRRRICVADG